MSEIADILDRAADLIEQKGWTQEVYARGKSGREVSTASSATCFCTLGAINVAAGGAPDRDYPPAIKVLEGMLATDPDFFGIPDWNDSSTRTQAEVVAKLRKAAAKARAQS